MRVSRRSGRSASHGASLGFLARLAIRDADRCAMVDRQAPGWSHAADGSALAADAVSLEIDAKNLAPGTYRASVRFFTSMGANSPAVAVTLRVVAAE